MAFTPLDAEYLAKARQLAEGSFGLTEPNPRVGCVIALADGTVLGEGATQAAGGAHAEVMALRAAHAAGHAVRGATAWVTLEPCAHHGRTPPCADALVREGLARVVVGAQDPNPVVDGGGIARLRAAGIAVDVAPPDEQQRCRALNIGFLSRHTRGRPWVRLKVATSLDGRTALADGRSQWITGPEARADGHAWRRRASVVLSASGTVLADNARLDVRSVPTPRQPLRVLLDRRGRLPAQAAWLAAPGPKVVLGPPPRAELAAVDGLEQIDFSEHEVAEGLAPSAVLAWLHARGANEVHLEAGPTLNAAWLQAGLVDELLLYQGPLLLGPGLPLAALPAATGLAEQPRWQLLDALAVGADLRSRWLHPAAATWHGAPAGA